MRKNLLVLLVVLGLIFLTSCGKNKNKEIETETASATVATTEVTETLPFGIIDNPFDDDAWNAAEPEENNQTIATESEETNGGNVSAPKQEKPNTGNVNESKQDPPSTGNTSGSKQEPPSTGNASVSQQEKPNAGNVGASVPEKPSVDDSTGLQDQKPENEPTKPAGTTTDAPTEKPSDDFKETVMTEYEKYQAMSAQEQMDYMNSFESVDAFFAWFNAAKEEYDAQQDVIEIGNGPIDMSGFFEESGE